MERSPLVRLALCARRAHERGETGYEDLARWVEFEARTKRARGEEPDEEALWVEALEERLAHTFWRGFKDYGLPRVAQDLEHGGYIGSYGRPSPGEQIRATTEEGAKKAIFKAWARRIFRGL